MRALGISACTALSNWERDKPNNHCNYSYFQPNGGAELSAGDRSGSIIVVKVPSPGMEREEKNMS